MATSFTGLSLWDKLWGVVYVVGAVLRLWMLDASQLWYDERLQAWVSTLPLGRMLETVGADVHPPAHYLITWALTHLGLTGWVLRLPSVAFGLAALVLTRRLAQRIGLTPAAGLAAGVLAAVLPVQLHYSQEARMYALLQAVYLWALWALTSRRTWWQFALALAALPWIHHYGLIYAVTLLPLALLQAYQGLGPNPLIGWRQRAWIAVQDVAPIYALAAALYLPEVVTLAAQMGEQATSWWKTPATLGGTLYIFHFMFWRSTLAGDWSILGAALAFGLTGLAVVQAVRTRLAAGWTLIYLALAPMALALAIEAFYRPILLHRALIGMAVPLYLLVGHALTTLRPATGRLAWAMLAPVLLLGAVAYHPERAREYGVEVKPVDTYTAIRAGWQPGDLVIHGNPATLVDAWGRLDKPQALMPIQPGSQGVPSARFWGLLGVGIIDPAHTTGRAWLVWSAGPTIGPREDAAVAAAVEHGQTIWAKHTPIQDTGLWLLTPSRSSR